MEVLCRGSTLQGVVRTSFGLGSNICSPAEVTKPAPMCRMCFCVSSGTSQSSCPSCPSCRSPARHSLVCGQREHSWKQSHTPASAQPRAKEVFEPQMFLFCVWCLPECGIAYYPPSQYLHPTLESDGGGTSVDGVDRTVEKYLEQESEWQVRLPCTREFGICLCAPPKHLTAPGTSSLITFPSMR